MGGSLSHCSAATSLHRELHADSGRSTTGSLVSQSSSRPCSSKSNKSLEGIFEKTNKATAKPGVLALLEVSTPAVFNGQLFFIACFYVEQW